MAELILKFNDVSGEPVSVSVSVSVDKERFIVGRHSECDLCIVDSRLSREHLVIETFDGEFRATDRGSSNGTEINGERLFEAAILNDGDELDLGGFKIAVVLAASDLPLEEASEIAPPIETPIQAAPTAAPTAAPVPPASDAGIPKGILIAAGLMAGGVLLILAILVVISISSRSPIENSNFVRSTDPDDEPTPTNRRTPEPANKEKPGSDPPANGVTPPSNSNLDTLPPPTNLSENAKVELNAAAFMRKIAQNNPKAFVTGEQASIIASKIKSLSGSSGLADNISSARKNAAAIKALAVSKNLKPQFLAVAAITSLGSNRGDVLQAAQKMADPLDKLGTQVGNEFADDCLLMIAAYDQGDPMKMRNMLQDLATKATESSRTIRTIWYLKKAGKITDSEYDMALRFLAIGTITQNPRDFGVNTESLNF